MPSLALSKPFIIEYGYKFMFSLIWTLFCLVWCKSYWNKEGIHLNFHTTYLPLVNKKLEGIGQLIPLISRTLESKIPNFQTFWYFQSPILRCYAHTFQRVRLPIYIYKDPRLQPFLSVFWPRIYFGTHACNLSLKLDQSTSKVQTQTFWPLSQQTSAIQA